MTKDQAATAAQERVPSGIDAAQEERIRRAAEHADQAIRQVAQAALEAGPALEIAIGNLKRTRHLSDNFIEVIDELQAILDALQEWDTASKAIQRALRGE